MVKFKLYVYVQEPQEVENHRTVRHHCPHRHRQFLPHPELQKLGHTDLTDPTDNHVAFMDDKVTQIPRIPQIIMSLSWMIRSHGSHRSHR